MAHKVPEDRQTPQRPPQGYSHKTGGGETKDHNPPDIYPLCQTEALRATRVQSPRHLPGHHGWTFQVVLGIHNKTGDDGRKLV